MPTTRLAGGALFEPLEVHGQGVPGDSDDGCAVAEGADFFSDFGAVHVTVGL